MTGPGIMPPASLAELRARIVRRDIRLGRQAETVLRYVVENPEDAAFGTCKSIAQSCKVSGATVDRLAGSLGFSRFADFRDLFRQSLHSNSNDGPAGSNGPLARLRRGRHR